MTFRVLWAINLMVALVFAIFFVIGLADGSVSSFNIVLWLGILFTLGAVLWGGRALRAAGRAAMANGLLMLLAIPGVIAGLFFLLLVVLKPNWQ
jgi:hypothetical protein